MALEWRRIDVDATNRRQCSVVSASCACWKKSNNHFVRLLVSRSVGASSNCLVNISSSYCFRLIRCLHDAILKYLFATGDVQKHVRQISKL